MSDYLKARRGKVNEVASIEITGAFDSSYSEILAFVEDILAEGNKDIILDFGKVSYLTSPGISCVVKILKKVQALKGRLTITSATDDMLELFKLAKLDTLVHFASV